MKRSRKGLTLLELLIVVNILAILVGVASILYTEFSDEVRMVEIYAIFPQIIRSQGLYMTQYNRYYTARNHDELRTHRVDLSEVQYFTYSTFPSDSSFSIRAEATDWAPGGWVLFAMRGSPQWRSDGVVIERRWLPQ